MRKTLSGLISATALLTSLTFNTAQAASVWEVTDGNNTLYLGGTLHILSPQDYPLPKEYDIAYDKADTLVFETDLSALDSADFVRKTLQLMTYQDGRTIKDDLSAETYQQLSTFLTSRGVPIEQVSHMKPSLLGISLSMLEMQRQGLTSQGVDKYFFARAEEDKKVIDWFETPVEQLTILSRLGEGEEDVYIQYTLDELATMKDLLGPMKSYWLTGDMKGLYDSSMNTFKSEYPDVYADVLTNRNNAWFPKLKAYLGTPETEFVLVGTMHMAGEEGVLALLKKAGFIVTKVHD